MGFDPAGVADPQFARGADQHLQRGFENLLLKAKQTQSGAALSRRAEGGGQRVVGHLFEQRRGIHDHGVDAAGFGDEGDHAALALRELPLNCARGRKRAGEDHASDARIGHKPRADRAVAGQELQHALGHAGAEQQIDSRARHQRRLLRRLGQRAIARHKRRRDLPDKNRQRKIPRGYAGEQPAPAALVTIGLPRNSRQVFLRADPARLFRIIAAEIGGLAHLGEGVVQRLAGLILQQRDQPPAPRLDRVGGFFQHFRTRFRPVCGATPERSFALRRARAPRRRRRLRRRRRSPRRRLATAARAPAPHRQPWARRRPSPRDGAQSPRAARKNPRGSRIRRRANCGAAARKSRRACADVCGGRVRRASCRAGSARIASSGTPRSAARATKEELAPFSISRRAR